MKRLCVLVLLTALLAGCKDDSRQADKREGSGEPGAQAAPPAAHVGSTGPAEYSRDERRFLLDLARRTLAAAVAGREAPRVDEGNVPAKLKASKGCFVTLNRDGRLRGCIGYIFPQGPLYKAVVANAVNASRDWRFRLDPVRSDELGRIQIEISVLTVPQPLEYQSLDDLLKKLRPNVDGVVFEAGSKRSTLLPQVWKKLPDRKKFMVELAEKAGLNLPDWAWTPDSVKIMTYQAEVFHE